MPSPSKDDVRRFVICSLSQAFGSDKQLPWQVAARLLHTGLLNIPDPTTSDETKVLSAALTPRQGIQPNEEISTFAGPHGGLFELQDWLNSTDLVLAPLLAERIRELTLQSASLDRTRELADNFQNSTSTEDLSQILEAAAQLDDALSSDWGWQVRVLRDASKVALVNVVKRQIQRLLRFDLLEAPTLAYLQTVFSEATETLRASTQTKPLSLQEARDQLSRLAPHVGHLPWSCEFGFPTLLSRVAPDERQALWGEIATFASELKPAWWFHAWLTAMRLPKGVAPNQWNDLWTRLSIMLSEPSSPAADLLSADEVRWNLYSKLARFFLHRLEVGLPDGNTQFIFFVSSRLASDVLEALIENHIAVVDGILAPAYRDVLNVWQLTAPGIIDSPLRSVFLQFKTPWSAAIQASITQWNRAVNKDSIPLKTIPSLKKLIQEAAVRYAVSIVDDGSENYDLLVPQLTSLHEQWKDILPDSEAVEWLSQSAEMRADLESVETVSTRFSAGIDTAKPEDQVVVLRWTYLLRRGQISISAAWDLLRSGHWSQQLEPSLDEHDLEHILSAVLAAPWPPTDIKANLPHWSASRCLANTKNDTKCTIYCIFTIMFSIKAGTTSAVLRLRTEDKANLLLHRLTNVQSLMIRMLPAAPPRVCGRIRAVLAALTK